MTAAQVKLLKKLAPSHDWAKLPSGSLDSISMSFAADVHMVLSHESRSSPEAPIRFELQWPLFSHHFDYHTFIMHLLRLPGLALIGITTETVRLRRILGRLLDHPSLPLLHRLEANALLPRGGAELLALV